MKIVNLDEIDDSVVFSNIYGSFQRWRTQKSYVYTIPRPCHGFLYVMCSRVKIKDSAGLVSEYKHGTVLYLPKGALYSIDIGDPDADESDTLLINFTMQNKDCEHLWLSPTIYPVTTAAPEEYIDDFHKIINSFQSGYNRNAAMKSALYDILDRLMLEDKKQNALRMNPTIAPAILYLKHCINDDCSIPYLASLCALSESTFRKYFKKYTGCSPSKYIRELKINKAKELLLLSNDPLNVISDSLGFYDASYFCKCFAQSVGISPGEYKKAFDKNSACETPE